MKHTLILLAAITILPFVTASADLVYISDFRMISDRSTLVVKFGDDVDANGTTSFEVTFGPTVKATSIRMRLPHISDRLEFAKAIDTFLKTINDPDIRHLSILQMLDHAGWPLERK